MKTIRDALYCHRESLKKSFDSTPTNKDSTLITDVCDEAHSRMEKLINFFNDKIKKDEE